MCESVLSPLNITHAHIYTQHTTLKGAHQSIQVPELQALNPNVSDGQVFVLNPIIGCHLA